MNDKAVLNRVQTDLQEAQAEIETALKDEGSLGDSLSFGFKSLLAAVGQLFAGFNNHERRIEDHERQLKIALTQIVELQSKIHGLKISRGKAVAARKKAQAAIENARDALNNITVH